MGEDRGSSSAGALSASFQPPAPGSPAPALADPAFIAGLRFNGAVYMQEWKAFQFSFLGPNSFTIIQNGPDARIYGVEMDANATFGGLNLTVSGSFTDAKTRQDLCATQICSGTGTDVLAPKGTRLPVTPRVKLAGTARYAVPMGSGRGYLQGLIAYQSSASSDIRVAKAAALGRLAPYATGNLAIGYELSDYTFELFAQNIWDERGQITRFQQCGACDQRPYIVPIAPRTIGLRLGARF